MNIFLHIEGQKIGPWTIYEVRDALRSGKISADTKAWIKGMEEWKPLRQCGPFRDSLEIQIADAGPDTIVVSEEEREAISEKRIDPKRPRPWIRFWARLIDTPILMMPGLLFLHQYLGTDALTDLLLTNKVAPDAANLLKFFAATVLSWVITESLLLTCFTTTPGKWILNVKIRNDKGERLNFASSLRRSFTVLVCGMGLNYIFLQLICHAFAYFSLTTKGTTYWDRIQNLQITHGSITAMRAATALLIFFSGSVLIYILLGEPEFPLPNSLPSL